MALDQWEAGLDARAAAAAWLARLTSGACTPADQRAHAAWLAEAEAHRGAFEEVLRVWRAVPGAARLSRGRSRVRLAEQPAPEAEIAATRTATRAAAPRPAGPTMFGSSVGLRAKGRGRRVTLGLVSMGVHAAVVVALLQLRTRPVIEAPRVIPVQLLQPSLRADSPAPGPKPAPRAYSPVPPPKASPRTAKRPAAVHPPRPLIAPTVVPDELPAPGPKEESDDAPSAAQEVASGVMGGREDGVIGGEAAGGHEGLAGVPEVPPLLPARPADLAAVRAGIAHTLVYPPEARHRGWGGRAVVAFTLVADGSITGLELRQSSGHGVLDEAALEAIRRAAPFAPPGVDVLVVVPVSFAMR